MSEFYNGWTYRDAVGRKWKVLQTYVLIDEDTNIHIKAMMVRLRRYIPGIIALAQDNGDGTATVLLPDGFTTIYDKEEKE